MHTVSRPIRLYSTVVLMAFLILPAGFSSAAGAYVFWTNETNHLVGRVDNDGSNLTTSLCDTTNGAISIAAGGNYIYWVYYSNPGYIGRAVVDGSSPENTFITCNLPGGVVVDDTYIYWTSASASDSVGRANLDGSGFNQSWITGIGGAGRGLTLDSNYIYWTSAGSDTIGRANIDGTGANASWITGCTFPADVAVDGSYVYWTNFGGSTVGRANLDGSGVNQSWITGFNSAPWGIDVDNSYVYAARANYITRANIDGSGLNNTWITHFGTNRGIEVTGSSTPVTLVSFMAKQLRDHVKVEWATAVEIETAGFNIWRADDQNKDFVRVTDELIPAVGGPYSGVLYRWLDDTATPGTAYWYKLEDISYGGLSTWHGPVKAMGKGPGAAGQQ